MGSLLPISFQIFCLPPAGNAIPNSVTGHVFNRLTASFGTKRGSQAGERLNSSIQLSAWGLRYSFCAEEPYGKKQGPKACLFPLDNSSCPAHTTSIGE